MESGDHRVTEWKATWSEHRGREAMDRFSVKLTLPASIREAARFAETVLPIVQGLQRSGITSLRGLAVALNDRAVRAARGGQWQVSNVRNLLARCRAA